MSRKSWSREVTWARKAARVWAENPTMEWCHLLERFAHYVSDARIRAEVRRIGARPASERRSDWSERGIWNYTCD